MDIEITQKMRADDDTGVVVWANVKIGPNTYSGNYLIEGDPTDDEIKAEIASRF